MNKTIATTAVVLPVSALVFSTLVANVANTLEARGADPAEARATLRTAEVASAVLIIAAAAVQGIGPAIGATIVVGSVAYFWDRYILK